MDKVQDKINKRDRKS